MEEKAAWGWDALLDAEPPPRPTLDSAVARVMAVREHQQGAPTQTTTLPPPQRWLGQLLIAPEAALAALTPRFRALGATALLQEGDKDEAAIIALPGTFARQGSRLWMALLLFVLTAVSTVVTYALNSGETGANNRIVPDWGAGLMYGATLMAILTAHELGHFFASRRLGVSASYPFFLPLPLVSLFGTMGAFIQMKEPPPDRRALFTIGVAGPLAGVALAIPLTLLGLSLSSVQPPPVGEPYMIEGNNLLYALLKFLVFGRWLPADGADVFIHPIAFAGWAGLLVTALNLLPAGQLDGGHILFGLVGRRWGRRITLGVVAFLLALGFVWSGWWLWAIMITFLSNQPAMVLNDLTPLGPRQKVLAVVTLVLFFLLFTPRPLVMVP